MVIMVINGKWGTILCNHLDYGDRMILWVFVPYRHVLLIKQISAFFSLETNLFLGSFKRKFFQLYKGMQSTGLKSTKGEKGTMVGEQIRKELVGEADKWKRRDKVWNQLENGGISKYIEKLHGYDSEVMNNMVKTWKDGKVMVNDTYF